MLLISILLLSGHTLTTYCHELSRIHAYARPYTRTRLHARDNIYIIIYKYIYLYISIKIYIFIFI